MQLVPPTPPLPPLAPSYQRCLQRPPRARLNSLYTVYTLNSDPPSIRVPTIYIGSATRADIFSTSIALRPHLCRIHFSLKRYRTRFRRGMSKKILQYGYKVTSQHLRRLHSRPTKNEVLDRVIRVDHAGEFGADRIYAGQMAILGNTSVGPKIKEMWEQEKRHKATFEALIREYRIRPTALLPIWNIAGFALGAGTALLGTKGAMACTVAVEAVIVDHYNAQLRELINHPDIDKKVLQIIKEFRDEEQEHHDTGLEHGAKQAPFYDVLSNTIKFGCKVAIELSKVI